MNIESDPRSKTSRSEAESDVSRRHAMGRLAQYTAPVIVAALMSEQAILRNLAATIHVNVTSLQVAETVVSLEYPVRR